jgi:hypothetical protein
MNVMHGWSQEEPSDFAGNFSAGGDLAAACDYP